MTTIHQLANRKWENMHIRWQIGAFCCDSTVGKCLTKFSEVREIEVVSVNLHLYACVPKFTQPHTEYKQRKRNQVLNRDGFRKKGGVLLSDDNIIKNINGSKRKNEAESLLSCAASKQIGHFQWVQIRTFAAALHTGIS